MPGSPPISPVTSADRRLPRGASGTSTTSRSAPGSRPSRSRTPMRRRGRNTCRSTSRPERRSRGDSTGRRMRTTRRANMPRAPATSTSVSPSSWPASFSSSGSAACLAHRPRTATLGSVEDYTSKYKGEQVEVALFGGEYQEGVLTAYCYVDEVAHIELNGHILVPLQNIASLHCSSRCDAQANEDWPPRGLLDDDGPNGRGPDPDES